jgi:hypothetical protein
LHQRVAFHSLHGRLRLMHDLHPRQERTLGLKAIAVS